MMFWMAYGSASGACPPVGLAAWPARLASMTHLSANPRAFCLPGCYSLPYPEPKRRLRRDPGAFVISDGFLFWRFRSF
jgi:hypothetical protein